MKTILTRFASDACPDKIGTILLILLTAFSALGGLLSSGAGSDGVTVIWEFK